MEGFFQTIGTAATVPVRQFKPSKYQQAIFDFIDNGVGNGFVEAVAGSGKSTTLKKAAERLRVRFAIFLAFNTHIAKELREKLPKSVKVSTISAVGHGCVTKALGDVLLDEFKYDKLAKGYIKAQLSEDIREEIREAVESSVVTVIRYVHATLANPGSRDEIDGIIEHFGLDVEPEVRQWVYQIVPVVVYGGEQLAKRDKTISFSDQLWLPYRWNLQPFKNDFVFVDEAQDLTAAQLHMAMKCMKPGGRFLAVGDRAQAIYGFTGADDQSVENIITKTSARTFPLSICYRCPKSHVELAKKFVPEIEAAPDAPEGVVKDISVGEMEKIIRRGDMVLCRTTAPLISQCFDFIQAGIPAKVRGREIGQDLVSVLGKITKIKHRDHEWEELRETFEMSKFLDFVRVFEEAHTQALRDQPGGDVKLAAVLDKTQCLRVIYGAKRPKTVEEFEREINALFSNDTDDVVILSTVHRAKGLEADRTFILRRDLMPHPNAKGIAWQEKQENNLEYIAYTRAKLEMYFVA